MRRYYQEIEDIQKSKDSNNFPRVEKSSISKSARRKSNQAERSLLGVKRAKSTFNEPMHLEARAKRQTDSSLRCQHRRPRHTLEIDAAWNDAVTTVVPASRKTRKTACRREAEIPGAAVVLYVKTFDA